MEKRSLKQNDSLHLYCKKLADELNGKGYYMQIVLKPTYELRWDTKTVKEHLNTFRYLLFNIPYFL